MKTPDSLKILLLANTAETSRQWAEVLRPISDCILLDGKAIPEDQQPDVVVTDGNSEYDGDVGVIRVGNDSPADVNLSVEASPGELRLACQLLSEIVCLRRRELAVAEVRRRLYTDALTDPLTGLSNRRAWDKTLRERLKAVSDSHCLCLAIFDLDNFKQINDSFGHVAGDEVLKAVALAVCKSIRQNDFVARIGGDEFGLLISVADLGAAQAVVERVRTALTYYFLAKTGVHQITASAGLASVDATIPPTTPEELFSRADEALHRAKREGRNQTVS